MIGRYRKKPSVIDAIQFTNEGTNASEIQKWPGDPSTIRYYPNGYAALPLKHRQAQLVIRTPTGESTANVGDWVAHQIVNGQDDFWPIAGDVFAATYEVAPGPIAPPRPEHDRPVG